MKKNVIKLLGASLTGVLIAGTVFAGVRNLPTVKVDKLTIENTVAKNLKVRFSVENKDGSLGKKTVELDGRGAIKEVHDIKLLITDGFSSWVDVDGYDHYCGYAESAGKNTILTISKIKGTYGEYYKCTYSAI